MLLTWDDLLDTNPDDTELVSNGAHRMREIIQAGKTSTDLEHYQTGEHQFPTTEPGAPKDGQIWFDLVNTVLRRYNGTDQTQLNAVELKSASGAASTAMTTSYATIASTSVTTFAGSRVLLFSEFGAATATDIDCKFIRGVTNVSSRTASWASNTLQIATTLIHIDIDAPTAGTYTYALQAKGSGLALTPLIVALVL